METSSRRHFCFSLFSPAAAAAFSLLPLFSFFCLPQAIWAIFPLFPSLPPSLPRLLLPLLPLRPPEPSPPLVDGLRTTAEGGREALLPFFAPSSLVNGVRPCGGGGDSWLPPPPPPDPSQSCVCGGPLTNDCLTRSVGRSPLQWVCLAHAAATAKGSLTPHQRWGWTR